MIARVKPEVSNGLGLDGLMRGATASQIAQLFRMDSRTVRAKLVPVVPIGQKGASPLYAVHETLEYLVRPATDQVEERIKRMNPQDLPPLLHKEFWNGMRARQNYEQEAGNLYRVEAVTELVTRLCSALRMQILLLPDRIEREARLTTEQRDIVQKEADRALDKMRDMVIKEFSIPLQEPETLYDESLKLTAVPPEEEDLDDFFG
jgi:hypothetical protein